MNCVQGGCGHPQERHQGGGRGPCQIMGCECPKFSDAKPGAKPADSTPKPTNPNFDVGDDDDDFPASLHDRFFPSKPELDLPTLGDVM